MPDTKEKAYIGDVVLSIGMLSTLGNLHTVTRAEPEGAKLLCPTCTSPATFPKQKYQCQDDATHRLFTSSEAARGFQNGTAITVVDADTLAEAARSVLPTKELQLQVHPREDVERHTYAKGNVYIFLPSGTSPLYPILVALLQKRRDLILVAKTNMRYKDHLVTVDVDMTGHLVVREMVWPEDFKQLPVPQTDAPNPKLLAQAEMLLDASVEDFDEDEYRKDSRARVASVVEEAMSGKPAPKGKKAAPKKSADDDLAALLEAAIAQKKGKGKKAS